MASVTVGMLFTPELAGSVNDEQLAPFSVQVLSVGRPVTLNVTVAGNGEFMVVGERVKTVMPGVVPRVTVWVVGFAAIVKSEPTPNVTGLLTHAGFAHVVTVTFALLTNGAAGIENMAVIIVLLITLTLVTPMVTPLVL